MPPARILPPVAAHTDEHELPCAEALLAAALASMTAHAQGCCDQHRLLMARKVVDSLGLLADHPFLSPPFRAVLWDLAEHWRRMHDAARRAEADARLFHAAPGTVQ